ncbi:MAG: helix-turn-helix domain-containing protein [Candidatus Sungbacteria bacterium]|nr:helix-turn-helix domain-containing protein [Candidatus Sungbacteria bacterium]
MSDFKQDFGSGSLLGERLRQAREEMRMTPETLGRETRISSRYIRALESGDWRAFSAKVYAQGALKRVIEVCRMEDAEFLINALDQEWEAAFPETRSLPRSSLKNLAYPRSFRLTPRRIGIGTAVGLLVLVAGFWGIRLVAFAAPPLLRLAEPADHAGYESFAVSVRGRTEKESRLTVNGRELTLDERGNFDEKIELPQGAHELEFVSRNRFGKEQTVVRHIFVK